MTVSAVERRVAYAGNGITTTFSVPFQFFEIDVFLDGSLLSDGDDYVIEQENPGTSGSITTTEPLTGAVVIVGSTSQTQTLDLVDNDSAPAEMYEAALDRLTMCLQEGSAARGRLVRAPDYAAEVPELDFAAHPGSILYVTDGGVPSLVDIDGPDSPIFGVPASLIEQANVAASSAITAANAAAATAVAAQNDINDTATAATGAVNSAATSATTAIQSTAAAFELLYLGAKSSNPTTNNSGGALVEGNLYLNSTSGVLNIWHSGAWVTAYLPGASGVASFNSRSGSVSPANGDYTASQVTNSPAGNIAATTVQGALNELDSEKATTGSVAAVAADLSTLASATTAALAAKLASSSYTAADVIAKLLTVDGPGSGIDADKLDGMDSSAFSKVTRTRRALTASGTLVLGDAGNVVSTNVASANTLTIPLNSAVAIPVESQIDIIQLGAGQTTIVPTVGVTLISYTSLASLAGQGSCAMLYKIATDTWVLAGNLA